jgi:hypothetical protein
MIKLLSGGIPGLGEFFSVTELYAAMRRGLVARGFPEPQLGLRNQGGEILIARNNAWSPEAEHAVVERVSRRRDAEASVRVTISGLPEELAFEGALLRVTGRVAAPARPAVDEAVRDVQALIHGDSGVPGIPAPRERTEVAAPEVGALEMSTAGASAPKRRRIRRARAARRADGSG